MIGMMRDAPILHDGYLKGDPADRFVGWVFILLWPFLVIGYLIEVTIASALGK